MKIATFLVLACTVISVTADVYTSLWPYPATMTAGSTALSLRDFNLKVTNPVNPHKDYLHSAARRYSASITGARGTGCNASIADAAPSPLRSCTVTVADTSVALTAGVNESYTLDISSAGVCTIAAPTVWGAFHAMESLAQLAGENCTVVNAPISITDAPRFGFRGLMIDSARHFLPVRFVEHILDGMRANKLNIMHWHLSDQDSFPYVSELFPALSQNAYSPRATYTPDELRGMVEYAAERGVRIMPEFDMPGHGDWAEPQIMVLDGPCKNTINPTVDATYTFLVKFLKEVTTVFPDEFLFLGGDEVSDECWSGSPSVQAWMTAHNMNATGLGRHFWQQLTKLVLPSLNRTLGVWEDNTPQPNPDDLPKGSFGNVWISQSTLKSVVDRKFKSVLSGPWYLDQRQPGGCQSYSLPAMWKCFYDVEPLKGLNEEESTYVLGGQACQWGEGINVHDFDARTWTNMAAVAERLWSPRSMDSSDPKQVTASRLGDHVCRMNARGIDANPIGPSFCPMADFVV